MGTAQYSKEEAITESDDTLGVTPSWIIKWGTLTIFAVLLIILYLSSIINYPQIIESSITITTLDPPVQLISKSNAKLQYLFVEDGQVVQNEEILAVLESTSNYESVMKLKMKLGIYKTMISENKFHQIKIIDYGDLGDLQAGFNTLTQVISNYQIFFYTNLYQNKIKSLQNQIDILDKLATNQKKQDALLQQDFELTKIQYYRDSALFKNGVLSSLSWETSKKGFIKDQYSLEVMKASMLTLDNQRIQLKQVSRELQDQFFEKRNELEQMIITSIKSLNSDILKWENEFIVKTPCSGRVVLNEFWRPYQNIKFGDNILIVVPQNSDSLVGRIKLPILNSGKVKVGQRINIKLDGYPYVEYGIVNGTISNISSIPDNNFYTVEVLLPQKLTTTYNKKIEHNEKITGKAEIITDDISLLERFFFKFKSIFKK